MSREEGMNTYGAAGVNTSIGDGGDRSSRDGASGSVRPRTIALSDNRIDSRDLFIGVREIIIEHGGEVYRLRLTAQNKLILTK